MKTLPDLPYLEDYLELLDNIGGQLKSTEEHYAKILLDGVSVKRENWNMKQKIISPELSVGRMTFHTRNKLIKIVRKMCNELLALRTHKP